jgi:hypothetical protein
MSLESNVSPGKFISFFDEIAHLPTRTWISDISFLWNRQCSVVYWLTLKLDCLSHFEMASSDFSMSEINTVPSTLGLGIKESSA